MGVSPNGTSQTEEINNNMAFLLTNSHTIGENDYIPNWGGFSLKGIRPDGKCPVCNKTFKYNKHRGYICAEHLTSPKRYLVDFYFQGERIRRGTTLDGKSVRSFAEAHALLRQAQNEIDAHRFDPQRWKSKEHLEFQFSNLIWKWYAEKERLMNQGKRAPAYVPKLKTYTRRYYEPYFNNKDVREIFNLKDFANQLPENLSIKYQKNIVDGIKGFFNWLRAERLIPDIPVFPSIEVPEYMPKTISHDIQIKLLEFIHVDHKPIFTYLFYQGCRPGEVRGLKWDCIDGDIVMYMRTFSENILKEATKTKNIRHNLIFPEVLAVLPPRRFPFDFVFMHRGRPYSSKVLNRIFHEAVNAFNQQNHTNLNIELYEATKHSFGTQLINQGVPENLLQEWFGHKRGEMTKKYDKLKVVDAFRNLNTIIPFRQQIAGRQ